MNKKKWRKSSRLAEVQITKVRITKTPRNIFKNTEQILLDRWHLVFEQYLKEKKKTSVQVTEAVFQDNTGLNPHNSLKIHHTWPHSIQLLIMIVTFYPQVKIISHIFRLHYKSLLFTMFLDLKISRTINRTTINSISDIYLHIAQHCTLS